MSADCVSPSGQPAECARSRCVVGACHPPTEPVRCVFVADYETTPWRCERLAGHEGAHRSGPVAPSER